MKTIVQIVADKLLLSTEKGRITCLWLSSKYNNIWLRKGALVHNQSDLIYAVFPKFSCDCTFTLNID
jgi:hypothetical protein